jgi:alpha-beta hydrolase superfamily lysophospholipase
VKKIIKRLGFCIGVLVAVSAVAAYRLQAFDLDLGSRGQVILFKSQGDQLEGTLLMPAEQPSPPVVLIVHGDGAQDRWSGDGYAPLVNYLLSQGIAVFSWDKPGVGASQGNWLAQSMDDRAAEAVEALKRLRGVPSLKHSPMGFLGFSQAGWVVPQASGPARADFAVLVGPAINWRNQGFYYLSQRLKSQQLPPDEVARQVQREIQAFDAEFTQAAAESPCAATCTRQDFERRNSHADARSAIAAMQTPVMILMGAQDRNVDPDDTLGTWDTSLPDQTLRCIRKVPSATHGLLRSSGFDYQLASEWPWYTTAIFLMSGHRAYASGALESIATWVLDRKC